MTENNSPLDHFFLDNGMEVILYPMDSVRSFSLQIGLRTGSCFETEKTRGYFHFLEHIIVNSSKKYKKTEDIHTRAEELGVSYNAHVNHLETKFWFTGPEKTMNETLEFVTNLLRYPDFNEKRIEKTKKIILAEYHEHYANPYTLYAKSCDMFFYGDTNPYIYDSLGKSDIIESVTSQEIEAIYKKYYQPQNIKVCISGKFEKNEIKKLVKTLFDDWEGSKEELQYPKVEHTKTRKTDILIVDHPRDQMDMTIAFPIPGYLEKNTREQLKQRLSSYVLGEGRTSLLNKSVREKAGLSYSIYSDVSRWPYTGCSLIYSSLHPKNSAESIGEIKKILQTIEKKGIDQEHFNRGKNYKNLRRYLSFSSPESISDWLMGSMIEGDDILLPEDYESISNTVPIDEVNETFKEIFNRKNAVLMMMGDKKAIKKSGVVEAFQEFKAS
jgi:predicted Zn-dependent peptidase